MGLLQYMLLKKRREQEEEEKINQNIKVDETKEKRKPKLTYEQMRYMPTGYNCNCNCIPNQPERSKREDSVHKYIYKLVDGTAENAKEMHKGFVYSKEEAIEWAKVRPNAAYHELFLCNMTGMRCSEHCRNAVSEAR
jgi:hypothetical protein